MKKFALLWFFVLMISFGLRVVGAGMSDTTPPLSDVDKQLQQKKAAAAQRKKAADARAAEEVRRRHEITLECPAFDFENSRFTNRTYQLTLHLIDKSAGKVDQYGYYDWSDQRWYTFAGEDANVLWIFTNHNTGAGVHSYYTTETVTVPSRRCYTCASGETEEISNSYRQLNQEDAGACYRWSKGIDKNTRAVTINGYLLEKYSNSSHWTCNGAPDGPMNVAQQCVTLPYRAPPERLGD